MRWVLLISATLCLAYHFVNIHFVRSGFAAQMFLSQMEARRGGSVLSQIKNIQTQFDSQSQILPSRVVSLGLFFGLCLILVIPPRLGDSPPPVDQLTEDIRWRLPAKLAGFGLWSIGIVIARHYANVADIRQSYLMARYELGRQLLRTSDGEKEARLLHLGLSERELQEDLAEIDRLGGIVNVLDPTVLVLVVATLLFAWWWTRLRKDPAASVVPPAISRTDGSVSGPDGIPKFPER